MFLWIAGGHRRSYRCPMGSCSAEIRWQVQRASGSKWCRGWCGESRPGSYVRSVSPRYLGGRTADYQSPLMLVMTRHQSAHLATKVSKLKNWFYISKHLRHHHEPMQLWTQTRESKSWTLTLAMWTMFWLVRTPQDSFDLWYISRSGSNHNK